MRQTRTFLFDSIPALLKLPNSLLSAPHFCYNSPLHLMQQQLGEAAGVWIEYCGIYQAETTTIPQQPCNGSPLLSLSLVCSYTSPPTSSPLFLSTPSAPASIFCLSLYNIPSYPRGYHSLLLYFSAATVLSHLSHLMYLSVST
jgi:hypothetical protein